ncbi:hypothetical protein FA95DRAFT_1550018 [Auriscalpium vulgare]|uniref:Uncharacterized protein n=1 Tax=Auriscalpium vulgare TaxID=40419 RepID=A0ACB8R8D5_9AGAM|nr:hypothetical protein FA95DRAFT_1550018 [Auriscalpium vulgare]
MSLSRFFHSISHPNLKRGRSADELQLGRAKSPSSGPEAASRRRGPRASTAPGDPGVRSSSALRNSSLPVAGDVIDETTAADGDVASPQTITLPDAHAADKSDPPPGGALTSTLVVVWDQVKKGSKSTPGGSKLINAAEDKVAGALDVKDAYEPLVSAAATVFEDTGIAQHIEDGIDHFFEGMPVFMNALDAVADVHPFIAVAVMAFKTVYTLEVTRRDNEKKVIALYVEMKDMMAVLLQLHDVRDEKLVAPDKTTIEDRLRALVEKTADDIKACSNACDAYCKKKLLAKVFQGPLWDAKLLSFVDLFEKRRTDIEFALSVHTTETLEAMTAKLSTVDASTKQVNAKCVPRLSCLELRHRS